MFSKLYVDKSIINHPETLKIISKLKMSFEIIENQLDLFKILNSIENFINFGKKTLYLTRNNGSFLKKCPGTRNYICCDYNILHIASFCFMNCSYCILQTYFHPPLLQFFINHDKLNSELNTLFATSTVKRIGTGEYTDSLIWENWTEITKSLVTKFSLQNKIVLELKTKTTNINQLKNIKHNKKTILSWSLNTEKIIKEEEQNTTSLLDRLKAAAICESLGYPLAFHFDPLIIYDQCEKDYQKVIDLMFNLISPSSIVWISMGTLRFTPSLKSIIQTRFPSSKIIYGELIKGMDGKMRYFKPLRIKLYKHISKYIKNIAPNICLYLCMEDNQVWEYAMNFSPIKKKTLSNLLDKRAIKKCRLNPT